MVSCNVLHIHGACMQKNSGTVFHMHRVSWHNIPTILCQKVAIYLPRYALEKYLPCWSHRLQLLWKLKLNVWWGLLERAWCVQHLMCWLHVLGHEAPVIGQWLPIIHSLKCSLTSSADTFPFACLLYSLQVSLMRKKCEIHKNLWVFTEHKQVVCGVILLKTFTLPLLLNL